MQAVAQGKSLEEAGAAAGLTAVKVGAMSRESPDPRLGAAPEAVGRAFGTPVGQVAGPIQVPGGWMILRVDSRAPADTTAYDKLKGQITSDILQRRQNEFLQAWVASQRQGAKIQDLRTP